MVGKMDIYDLKETFLDVEDGGNVLVADNWHELLDDYTEEDIEAATYVMIDNVLYQRSR